MYCPCPRLLCPTLRVDCDDRNFVGCGVLTWASGAASTTYALVLLYFLHCWDSYALLFLRLSLLFLSLYPSCCTLVAVSLLAVL